MWPIPRSFRVSWLAAAFSAAAAAAASAQQIDPNVPVNIPEEELTNTIGILDRVLVDLLTPGTPPMLAAGLDLWRGLAIVLVVWTGLRIAYSGTGWRAWDIVSLVLTLWIPWLLLSTYDTDIPGIGMPFPMILPRGANEIATHFAGNTVCHHDRGTQQPRPPNLPPDHHRLERVEPLGTGERRPLSAHQSSSLA